LKWKNQVKGNLAARRSQDQNLHDLVEREDPVESMSLATWKSGNMLQRSSMSSFALSSADHVLSRRIGMRRREEAPKHLKFNGARRFEEQGHRLED
jgi:hypothetical protein